MAISRKFNPINHPGLSLQGLNLQDVPRHKCLGVIISSDLRWTNHINQKLIKASKMVNIMKSLKIRLNRHTLETVYTSFVRPLLEYGSPV